MKSLFNVHNKVKKILIILISMLVFTTIDANNSYWVHTVYTNKDDNTVQIQSRILGSIATCTHYDTISVDQAVELYDLLYCIYNDVEKFEKIYNKIISSIDTTFVFYTTENNNFHISYLVDKDCIYVSQKNVKRTPMVFDSVVDFRYFLFSLKLKTNMLKYSEIKRAEAEIERLNIK